MKHHFTNPLYLPVHIFQVIKHLYHGDRDIALRLLRLQRYNLFWLALVPIFIVWLPSCDSPQIKGRNHVAPPPPPLTTGRTAKPAVITAGIAVLAINRTTITQFTESKKVLHKIYENQPITFYCRCPFSDKIPNLKNCGVTPRLQPNRANRIEWEHITPAHRIAGHLDCWKRGGRKNCEKDPIIALAFSDLHNLVPAIGEINGDRSNYPFVDSIAGEARRYGQCDIEIENRRVEPPEYAKGFIARAYLYMNAVYNIDLNEKELTLMNQWNTLYPPDTWEIERNNIIARIQGNKNMFINQ